MSDGDSPTTQQPSEEQKARITALSNEFDELCYSRHAGIGREQYGNFKFLGNEHLIEDILEEIADLANYARYLYIKTRLIGEALAGSNDSTAFVSNAEHKDGLDVGPSSFTPAGKNEA